MSKLSTAQLSPVLRTARVICKAMNTLIGRFNDWRHERHIQHLRDACKEAMQAGDKVKARHFCDAMRQACKQRSSQQVARMELALFRRLAPHEQQIYLRHADHPGIR